MVRAKFKVTDIQPAGEGFSISLMTVSSGSSENDEFFKLTPAGNVTMAVVSEEVAKQFEVGKEFYVDFTPAEVAQVAE